MIILSSKFPFFQIKLESLLICLNISLQFILNLKIHGESFPILKWRVLWHDIGKFLENQNEIIQGILSETLNKSVVWVTPMKFDTIAQQM